MAQYAPEDPMVPKFDTESFESTDKMQKGSLLQSAMDAINDFGGIKSTEVSSRMSPRNQLMKDATDNKEKESLLDVGTKNAYWLLPAAMAAIGGLTSKKKDKKRNAMLGFQAGVQPGSQAFKTYMMENQKQALGFAQEVLNDPNIPDNVKTDPKFLTSYVSTRMGDKKFDRPALSQAVNDQVNRYFNIQANVGQDRVAIGKEFRLLNLQAFSESRPLDLTNPAGRHYTSDYEVYNYNALSDSFNDAFKEADLPPLTKNNIGKGAEGYFAWVGLTPEQREKAREILVESNFDPELIGSVLPNDMSSQLKEEKVKADIEKAKAKKALDEWRRSKPASKENYTSLLRAAYDIAEKTGMPAQYLFDQFKEQKLPDEGLQSYASKKEAEAADREQLFFTQQALRGLNENGWVAKNFASPGGEPDEKAFSAFKSTLPDGASQREADRIMGYFRNAWQKDKYAAIQRKDVRATEIPAEKKETKILKQAMNKETGEVIEQHEDGKWYYQGTDKEFKK